MKLQRITELLNQFVVFLLFHIYKPIYTLSLASFLQTSLALKGLNNPIKYFTHNSVVLQSGDRFISVEGKHLIM